MYLHSGHLSGAFPVLKSDPYSEAKLIMLLFGLCFFPAGKCPLLCGRHDYLSTGDYEMQPHESTAARDLGHRGGQRVSWGQSDRG